MVAKTPFTTSFQPIAHRGGAREAQENSLQAFHHAASLGYRYMETDMQVSADGEIYLFHDDRLERVSNGVGVFSDYKAAEIDKFRLHNGEPIPRLADALAELPKAIFNIDIKRANGTRPLAEFLSTHPEAERVIEASFHKERLSLLKELVDRPVQVTAVQSDVIKLKLMGWGLPLSKPDVVAAQVPLTHYGLPVITSSMVSICKKLDIKLHVWTIDDADVMRWLIDKGVDGVMTDKPSLLREVAQEKGVWPESY